MKKKDSTTVRGVKTERGGRREKRMGGRDEKGRRGERKGGERRKDERGEGSGGERRREGRRELAWWCTFGKQKQEHQEAIKGQSVLR
jgi:hypothetical protein